MVHSHVHRFSGFVLKVAQACGVPVRIAHSHSDTSQLDRRAAPLRQLYLNCMGRWIRRNATKGLAVSREAATSLFGPQWEKDGRFRIAYCGVDLAPFRNLPDAGSVRSELGIPAGAFVVGHVGRFEPPKNHAFLVEIATELVRIDCNARFLWVGDGTLRRATEEKVARAGLTRNVSFTGARSDVPCLLAAMDAFVFPSLYEGLGLVLIEAQAVGLPCFVADVLTREAKVVEPLFTPLSLLESPSTWAERISLFVPRGRPSVAPRHWLSSSRVRSISSRVCAPWKKSTMIVDPALENRQVDRASIALVQGMIFLATLLMLFGLWSDDQYASGLTRPMCIFFSVHLAWCFWSWHALSGRWLDSYSLFLLSLSLFNGGQLLLETFSLNPKGILAEAFSVATTNHMILLVNASVVACHLGGVVQCLRGSRCADRRQASITPSSASSFSPQCAEKSACSSLRSRCPPHSTT